MTDQLGGATAPHSRGDADTRQERKPWPTWCDDGDARLEAIRARLAKTSRGPWRSADDEIFYRRDALKCPSPITEGLGERILVSANHHFPYDADLDFIAHAPDDMAWLLTHVPTPTVSPAVAAAESSEGGGGGAPAAGEREALVLALRKSARAYHHEMHRLSDPQNREFESCSSPVCQDAVTALRAPAPPRPHES